ncbi:MAG: cytidine deaminase, partial [Pseudomonadota bacterium]
PPGVAPASPLGAVPGSPPGAVPGFPPATAHRTGQPPPPAIVAVAIAGPGPATEGGKAPLCTPCGGCRQRLREFAPDPAAVHVLVCDPTGVAARFTLAELLPASFGPGNLG